MPRRASRLATVGKAMDRHIHQTLLKTGRSFETQQVPKRATLILCTMKPRASWEAPNLAGIDVALGFTARDHGVIGRPVQNAAHNHQELVVYRGAWHDRDGRSRVLPPLTLSRAIRLHKERHINRLGHGPKPASFGWIWSPLSNRGCNLVGRDGSRIRASKSMIVSASLPLRMKLLTGLSDPLLAGRYSTRHRECRDWCLKGKKGTQHGLDAFQPRTSNELLACQNHLLGTDYLMRTREHGVRPEDVVDADQDDDVADACISENIAVEPLYRPAAAATMQQAVASDPLVDDCGFRRSDSEGKRSAKTSGHLRSASIDEP